MSESSTDALIVRTFLRLAELDAVLFVRRGIMLADGAPLTVEHLTEALVLGPAPQSEPAHLRALARSGLATLHAAIDCAAQNSIPTITLEQLREAVALVQGVSVDHLRFARWRIARGGGLQPLDLPEEAAHADADDETGLDWPTAALTACVEAAPGV